jgi:hypothetical protein
MTKQNDEDLQGIAAGVLRKIAIATVSKGGASSLPRPRWDMGHYLGRRSMSELMFCSICACHYETLHPEQPAVCPSCAWLLAREITRRGKALRLRRLHPDVKYREGTPMPPIEGRCKGCLPAPLELRGLSHLSLIMSLLRPPSDLPLPT